MEDHSSAFLFTHRLFYNEGDFQALRRATPYLQGMA
jgi:hypothetical protein